tara:strand:+ start:216 stop:983 length:768 start_codon:yes stop_codon:yes gene_type:complete
MSQNIIEITILSAIQGIFEFLPISSSAHLILVSNFYDFKSSSLIIDISLHLGSLLAIIFYFRKELFDLKNNLKLLNLLIIGSIPLILFGYLLHSNELIFFLRNLKVITFSTLFFAIILFFSDRNKTEKNISSNLDVKSILFIGFFQILALIPGVSRAGITMTAARFLKFKRVDASKISFLLSIPALTGASFLGLKEAWTQVIEINYLLIISISLSFLFSLITIKFFLNFISKFSLNTFVVYRILVGFFLIYVIYF